MSDLKPGEYLTVLDEILGVLERRLINFKNDYPEIFKQSKWANFQSPQQDTSVVKSEE